MNIHFASNRTRVRRYIALLYEEETGRNREERSYTKKKTRTEREKRSCIKEKTRTARRKRSHVEGKSKAR